MKPRLLLFQYRYEPDIPGFLLAHSHEHIRCLELSFDVTVVSGDCDYDKVCDSYRPDLAAFEIGLQIRRSHRPKIANTHTQPSVPKIGLMNADAWGATRSVILSDVERLDLKAVFAICTTAGEHLPAISERLFYWPNFVDPSVFHDYGQEKIVPIAITGVQNSSYPWRQTVYPRLAGAYPAIVCPHKGYTKNAPPNQMLVGKEYARVLASAWFSPTCGTVAKELVRKHLEIPACKTALITEASPAIASAGFVDMENCILADERDVLDKINYFLENPDRLTGLINAGHELVMSRHTIHNRTQVADWFALSRAAGLHQRVVQANPFEALSLSEQASERRTLHVASGGTHLGLIKAGDNFLRLKNVEEAEAAYSSSLGLFDTMAEPKLRLVICDLLRGESGQALRKIVSLIKETLSTHRDVDPDPAEWAYFIVCLLCIGRTRAARRRVRQYPHLSHPDLARVRAVVHRLDESTRPTSVNTIQTGRGSLHETLYSNDEAWLSQLREMLIACGREGLAKRLLQAVSVTATSAFQTEYENPRHRIGEGTDARHTLRKPRPMWLSYFPGSGLLRGLDNPLFVSALTQRAGDRLALLFDGLRRND